MKGMGLLRARRPLRLALIVAALAVAGGAPAARACYAEVSARAVAVVRAEAERATFQPKPVAVVVTPARVAVVVTPAAPSLVAAPLYLAHCSLLL